MMGKNTTTSTDEINQIGNLLFGNKFRGAFPRDYEPKLFDDESCILNLDTSEQEGSHWVAVMKFKNGEKLIYDSFGRNLHKWHIKGINTDMTDREQRDRETNCGMRCLAFLCVCYNHGHDIAKMI